MAGTRDDGTVVLCRQLTNRMSLTRTRTLFFFGVGNTAHWVAAQVDGRYSMTGTTRDAMRVDQLKQSGIEAIILNADALDAHLAAIRSKLDGADVLVSFPPDPKNDHRFAPLVQNARAVVYISSTGVYGRKTGMIDESVQVDSDYDPAKPRLDAERIWQDNGAIVLRAPGLYCPTYGLHVRLRNGTYRLPADGKNFTSRIHLKDLGRIILETFEKLLPARSTYVVGDLKPATQLEVVTWLCERMNLVMPQSVPLDAVADTLRANRQISSTKILHELDLELEFPTYKEGFEHCLSHGSS